MLAFLISMTLGGVKHCQDDYDQIEDYVGPHLSLQKPVGDVTAALPTILYFLHSQWCQSSVNTNQMVFCGDIRLISGCVYDLTT